MVMDREKDARTCKKLMVDIGLYGLAEIAIRNLTDGELIQLLSLLNKVNGGMIKRKEEMNYE